MRSTVLVFLFLASCTSAPPPNPRPVTVPGRPVEVVYRQPTTIYIGTAADSVRYLSVTVVSGKLIERRGDTSLVSVQTVRDSVGTIITVRDGVLRVRRDSETVVRQPIADQQMAEMGFAALLLVGFVTAAYLVFGGVAGT